MKIVLTTTFLVAVLSIGIFGINNAFAQGNNGMMAGRKSDRIGEFNRNDECNTT